MLRRLRRLRGSVSLGRFAPTLNSTHIFASPGNLRFPLSGLQKRHIQPGRYATYFLEWLTRILKYDTKKYENILSKV
jgi:hypothetical protein